MPSDHHKKNNQYGVLCGLRASALGDSDSDSDSSRSSTPEPPPKDEVLTRPSNISPNQRRPQSLTLPFENRDRESHLVSDEEFDRIVRQAEFETPLPKLPQGRARNLSAAGLRRSISTARNTTFMRQRPVSMDIGAVVALSAVQNGGKAQPVSISRESTLTAMPRPPTMNEFAVYPGQIVPVTPRRQQSSPYGMSNCDQRNAAVVSDSNDGNVFRDLFQQGHKRNRSAAQVVESVKKRLKRSANSPTFDSDKANSSSSKLSLGSPIRRTTSYAASVQYQYGQPVHEHDSATDSSVHNTASNAAKSTTITSNNLKKSLLTRTWSRTKQHAKKLSISQLATNGSRPSISDPISLKIRPESAQSIHTATSTAASTATSQYYASAEPSPRGTYESSRSGTPNGEDRDHDFEFISGPPLKKHVLTRMGAPPRRSELNTVVARQQSRIVDLTLLNNVLVQQVESLRGEVEGMRVDPHRNQRARSYDQSFVEERDGINGSDCGYSAKCRSNYDSEQENYGYASKKRKSDGTASASTWSSSVSARRRISSGRVQKDPEGWKHIMGVAAEHGSERMEFDGTGDDKRKTWMTCDSET